jgi:hypothetical protein
VPRPALKASTPAGPCTRKIAGIFAHLRLAPARISLRRVRIPSAPREPLSTLRAARFLAAVALTLGVFEACSGDDSGTSLTPSGPASVSITSVSLSSGNVLDQGSNVLGCDYAIAVALSLPNWNLAQPGACTVPQCGQVRVTLLKGNGTTLLTRVSASAGAAFDVRPYFKPDDQGLTLLPAGTYAVRAELVDDAGNLFNPGDAGNSSEEKEFDLALPSSCDMSGSAGAGGAGAAGASSEGGSAGTPNQAGSAGIADSAGASSGGTADSAGAGGV